VTPYLRSYVEMKPFMVPSLSYYVSLSICIAETGPNLSVADLSLNLGCLVLMSYKRIPPLFGASAIRLEFVKLVLLRARISFSGSFQTTLVSLVLISVS